MNEFKRKLLKKILYRKVINISCIFFEEVRVNELHFLYFNGDFCVVPFMFFTVHLCYDDNVILMKNMPCGFSNNLYTLMKCHIFKFSIITNNMTFFRSPEPLG